MSLADALLAARLCAIDPGLGGMMVRGGGEQCNRVIDEYRAALGKDGALLRVPINVDDDRLIGGLDLAATLATGAPVRRTGILEEARGGAIVLPMAERIGDAMAGRIAAAIDGGGGFVTIALDDGVEDDERPPAALLERLGFWIDLEGDEADDRGEIKEVAADRAMEVIVATAAALGVDSARPAMFALQAAFAIALADGRDSLYESDITLAVRLVIGPRATRLPERSEAEQQAPPPPTSDDAPSDQDSGEQAPLEDIVLAAALAALPSDVLARIAAGRNRRGSVRSSGAGERRKSAARGRPMGTRAGKPGGGLRLSLIDTLRAAAPWQKLRGRDGRVMIRRDDLRIRRFETRAEAVTIFAVDASGSSALARLAEAKGAVELLLAEAYVKRAHVALVAFRGTGAALLLAPTRSLTRARRQLAELPGGGGTPLASGLNLARELAETAKARGRTPFVVVLTDGRANIASDGRAVRSQAEADATRAAKAIGAAGIASAFVDISARPRPEGAALAAAMGARYLPLPRADAAAMHAAVRAAQRR